ncbi:MAG: SusC/RagA family TonB-linked outer membrane protein [Bacteroidota bacterium]
MKHFLRFCFIGAFFLFTYSLSAQITVSGTVKDASTNETLIGATVLVKGTALGTVTDINGKYSIELPGSSGTLVYSFIGYETLSKDVSSSSTMDVVLNLSSSSLDEVIVNGFATTVTRRNSANAVARVSAKELTEVVNQQTMEGALQGQFAGAEIKSASGAPGGGFSVKMRGVTSVFGNQQPLYILDGVFLNNSTISSGVNTVSEAAGGGNTSTNQDDASNRIADIDPEDIESVEVLKGASAAAIYGSRAAGGVVIITTKRGKAGKARVSLSQTIGTIRPISLLGTRDWNAENVEATGGPDALAVFNAGGLNDYESELFDNTGTNSTSRLTISGGTDKTKYMFGATYKNENGIVENTGYEKASFRLNLDQNVTDWFDVSLSMNYVDSEADRGFFNNGNTNTTVGYALAFTYPWEDLFADANGVYPAGGAGSNVLETVNTVTNRENVDRFIGGLTANFNLFRNEKNNVKFQTRAGMDTYTLKNTGIFPQSLTFYQDPSSLRGVLLAGNTTSQNTNMQGFLIWSHYSSSGITFTTSAGASREDGNLDNNLVTATGLIGSQTNVDQADNVGVNQTKSSFVNHGYVIQEEINYQEKIFLTLGVRADKSTNNGDSDELFFYPKANVAFNLPELGISPSGRVSTLKPRIAYGESQRPPVFSARFNTLNPTFIGQNSGVLTAGILGNPDILPERQKELEFGADVGINNDNIVVGITYYIKTIEDLLLRDQIEPSSGFTTQWVNAGTLQNKGLEITADAGVIKKENFSWSTGINWWMNRSEITELNVDPFNTGGFAASLGQFRIEEGKPATQLVGTVSADDAAELDPDGDGFAVYGDAEPDFQMNWRNSINYENWSLDFLFHWKEGGDNINLSTLLYDLAGTTWDYDDTTLDPSGAMVNGDYRTSEWFAGNAAPWIEDASYIRLRQIGLYRKFPLSWSDGTANLSLGISATNLINIFDYNSYDPEVSNFGGNVLANNVEVTPFPSSKRLNFHIKANF